MNKTTRQILIAAVGIAALSLAVPASAGVGIGVTIGGNGFSFSLGYNDYPVYGDAWYSPSWSLDFNTALSGYGEWVSVSGLGRVWHPYVASGWRPYTHGRWVYTSLGWTWISYEPWGYVPHHYGSWALTSFGWAWVPGYTYSPANVVWVTSGSYIGWYAAGPAGWSQWRHGFRHRRDRGYRHGYDDGFRDGWRDARFASFVDWRHLADDNLARYCRPGASISRLSEASVRRLSAGPSRSAVSRATGRSVGSVAIARRTVHMEGHSVTVVRPRGMARSVSAHARSTVRTALSPGIARTFERGGRVVNGARSSHTSATAARQGLGRVAPATGRTYSERRAVTSDDRRAVQQRSFGTRELTRRVGRERATYPARERQPAIGTRNEVRSGAARSTARRSIGGSATARQSGKSEYRNLPNRAIGNRTIGRSSASTRSSSRRTMTGRTARPTTRSSARSTTRASSAAAGRRGAVRPTRAVRTETGRAGRAQATSKRRAGRTPARNEQKRK